VAVVQDLSVKPRHVLCFLDAGSNLSRFAEAAEPIVQRFGFKIDHTYSQGSPDPNMQRSFEVCRDRVSSEAWTSDDEEAVRRHRSVLYVLGPAMDQQKTVAYSAAALRIVEEMIDAGAVAVKGESAGVAHGFKRWRQLAEQCKQAAQTSQGLAVGPAMGRICRLAFARRPLASERYLESVGFHLVGLPEVYVSRTLGSEWDAVHLMDDVADEMARRGVNETLEMRKLALSQASSYAEDDFKYNPYGIVHIDA
jgi:hypothetical protein